ncbi:MAG: Mrr restriction system protein [Anaerolineales bacterium]|nr:Mrr restriction system protein [Anaerolineales bacterium]
MSNITMKRAGELLRSVFEILWDKPEGLTAKEVLALIPDFAKLTEEELKLSPETNTPRYEKIIRISTIPFTHAGWLIKNEKGRWYITEDGYQACRKFTNVQDFYTEAVRIYNIRRRVAPESVMEMEIAQETAWAQIEKHLHQLSPSELQLMLAELLRAMEYYPSWMAPAEKQRGQINLIAFSDPIGAKGQRIMAQIKHKGQAVTLEGIKSFLSAINPNDYGMIVSMSGFTNDAMQELHSNSFQRLTALDAPAFFDLWKQYYELIDQKARYLLPLKPIHFLSGLE